MDFFRPPPQREYDERVRQIEGLVLRDALLAVVLLLLLGLLVLELPAFQGIRMGGYALLPLLAIWVFVLVTALSRTARQGWNWSRRRWNAKMLLLLAPAIALLMFAGSFVFDRHQPFSDRVVFALLFMVCALIGPLLLLVLARGKE